MCVFQSFPSPLEYRKAVPQALGASEERQPEGGTIKSRGDRVNSGSAPPSLLAWAQFTRK